MNPQETFELVLTLQELVHDLVDQMRAISEASMTARPAGLVIEPESW